MKNIKKIETEELGCGHAFDIVYLNCGFVIVIAKSRIGFYESEEDYNNPNYEPMIIETEPKNNLNLN